MATEFLAVALAASAVVVDVELRLREGKRLEDSTAWVVAIPSDAAALKALPRGAAERAPRGSCSLALAPGLWTLGATSEGAWVAPFDVDLRIASNQRKKVSLSAWPAARLRARLRQDTGVIAKGTIPVSLKASSDGPDSGVPATTVSCPVENDRLTCDLPAVALDIQVREEGHVPHYLWDLRPTTRREFDLGDLVMRSGSSVVGWVYAQDHPVFGAQVELRDPAPPLADDKEDPEPKHVAQTDRRGFFQFGPLAPGSYVVSADQGVRVGPAVAVVVGSGAERVIRQPIKLTPAHRLRITVKPPSDPEGRPWKLNLLALGDSPLPATWGAVVPSDGTWVREGLPGGSFRLFVVDEDGARWATRALELSDSSDGDMAIDLAPTEARGRVRLGEEPLPGALVRVSDRDGIIELRARTDEAGELKLVLPEQFAAESSGWNIRVESEAPLVRRTLREFTPERSADGAPYLDVRLAGARLRATLVDPEHQPWTKHAVVTLQGLANSLDRYDAQLGPDDTATVEFEGLEPGDYLVEAKGTGGFVSDQVVLAAGAGPRTAEAELVLSGRLEVTGVVEAFDRTPLTGARVRGLPAQAPVGGSRDLVTGSDGSFSLNVPPSTTAVLLAVAARGFGYRIGRFAVGPEPLAITLDRAVGSLALEHRSDLEGEDGTYVRVDGGFENIRTLRDWSGATTRSRNGTRTTVIDGLAPGHYAVCRVDMAGVTAFLAGSMERCAAGVVRPGETLRVQVPEPRSAESKTPPAAVR